MAKNPVRVAIVEARFYSDLSDALLEGAKDALTAFGAEHEVFTVPGALEIPGAIALLDSTKQFDGFVALGVVIRGETYHFEIVANESARGIMELTLKGVPVGNGVLTTEDEDQAWARARMGEGDKGGFAARACLDLIALARQARKGA